MWFPISISGLLCLPAHLQVLIICLEALQAPVFSAEPEKSSDDAAETKQPVKTAKPTESVATAGIEGEGDKPTSEAKKEVRVLNC